MMKDDLVLGLDLSTQSLTAVLISRHKDDLQRYRINFDQAYPYYQTQDGVLMDDDPKWVHSNPIMWLEALDDMLHLLHEKGLTTQIIGIGVSAQQHGTVYLNQNAADHLANLEFSDNFAVALKNIFSRNTSPVWMDSSTSPECAEITEVIGGDAQVAHLTGSVASERFAGPQIRKFVKLEPENYQQTTHIALISSFVTSLLIGRLAPVDGGDGFGTNLADIRKGSWSDIALDATAPELKKRLPQLITNDDIVGTVSPYLVEKYGFRPETKVIVGSGDNPCSLVGLGLIGQREISAISLGTSDTYFGYLKDLLESKREYGHIFGTADGNYMFLICFKNGSLAREHIKNKYGLSWKDFSNILMETRPGNLGRIMLPYLLPEITPKVLEPGLKRFGGLRSNDAAAEVRAIAEAQAMAMYLHSKWTGHRPDTILVTAGGSDNKGLLKVISQVFGAEVRSFEAKESAALGAAVRAARCCLNDKGKPTDWQELIEPYIKYSKSEIFKPSKEEVAIYSDENGLLNVYKACEAYALGRGENPQDKINAFKQKLGLEPQ